MVRAKGANMHLLREPELYVVFFLRSGTGASVRKQIEGPFQNENCH